jgi:hypothetical protein
MWKQRMGFYMVELAKWLGITALALAFMFVWLTL